MPWHAATGRRTRRILHRGGSWLGRPHRRLGRSGLVVSVVGLGTNNLGMKLDEEQSREVVHAALDAGITLFDTADSYGASAQRLGELLAGHRDDVVLATKFGGDSRARGNDNGADWGAGGEGPRGGEGVMKDGFTIRMMAWVDSSAACWRSRIREGTNSRSERSAPNSLVSSWAPSTRWLADLAKRS